MGYKRESFQQQKELKHLILQDQKIVGITKKSFLTYKQNTHFKKESKTILHDQTLPSLATKRTTKKIIEITSRRSRRTQHNLLTQTRKINSYTKQKKLRANVISVYPVDDTLKSPHAA